MLPQMREEEWLYGAQALQMELSQVAHILLQAGTFA